MRHNVLSVSLALGFTFTLLTSYVRNPNNPPTAKTGAPGETTCTSQSGCHSGGTFTGTVVLSGVPDTVVFGHVYPLTLKNTSNAVRAGFQLTCLDSVNVKCGTLATASGVSVATSSGRQYARQSAPKNLANGSTSWTFNWTAPATASGNKATFYFVTLCSNNNGGKTGDNVLISTKPVVFTSPTSPTTEPALLTAVKVYPTQVTDVLHVELLNAQQGRIYFYTTDGRMVQEKELSANNTLDVSSLKTGTYLTKIQTPTGAVTKKILKY